MIELKELYEMKAEAEAEVRVYEKLIAKEQAKVVETIEVVDSVDTVETISLDGSY